MCLFHKLLVNKMIRQNSASSSSSIEKKEFLSSSESENKVKKNDKAPICAEGCFFTHKHRLKTSNLYKCRFNRNKESKCTAKLKVHDTGLVETIGEHDETCYDKFGLKNKKNKKEILDNVDFASEMITMADDLAISRLDLSPVEIWTHIKNEMNKKSKTWKGWTNRQVIKRVSCTRTKANSADIFRMIEKDDLAMVKNSSHFFFAI